MIAPSPVRAIKAVFAITLLVLLPGCAPFNYSGEDSPIAQTAITALNPKPQVALVLSSGGQRGYAHLGVMKALEDADESLPIAVRAARQAGALFVIAVDVSAPLDSIPEHVSMEKREQMQHRAARIADETAAADFLIHVRMKYYAPPFDSYFEYARAAGEQSARTLLPELTTALKVKCQTACVAIDRRVSKPN